MRILILVLLSSAALADEPAACDFFCYLGEANKASLVMLAETGLVPGELAARIAAGVEQVIAEQDEPGARRSSNYLDFEKRLIELTGAEASRIHTGRSRQDLHETVRRMLLRRGHLEAYASLLQARAALLDLAERHAGVVIPAYTHGVQAQPTSLGHYLLAFSNALGRDAARLEEAYTRLNLSPLGAAAFGTSGFPLDRHRLAQLLGFVAPVENSYDANLVSSADVRIELAGVLAQSSIAIGQLMQNIHTQYHNPVPWMLLDQSVTDVSSIMPQKRNPRPLDRVRRLATRVLGDAHTIALNAHNTNTGMHDYRQIAPSLDQLDDATDMYRHYADVLDRLHISPERALAEVTAGYSTMTEVADVLLREADVPFRTAHHYASELTEYGRARGRRPADLGDRELRRIYRDATGDALPVDVRSIRDAMDPAAMVRNRKGFGGPQPEEVRRMLASHRDALDNQMDWLTQKNRLLAAAGAGLQDAFRALTGREPADRAGRP